MKAIVICDEFRVHEAAALCEAHGFGIEMQAFHDPVAMDDPALVEAHVARIAGIRLKSMHAPFADLCPGSSDPMVREVARHRLDQAYAIGLRLGVQHVVVHHGYVPHTSWRDGWLKRSQAFWKSFLEDKSANVCFHAENLLEWEPTLISDVVNSVGSARFDINLDVGHAHCNSRTPVLKWIETLGMQIGYVHLHDNHGTEDDHLGFGLGSIPMDEVCHALEQHAPGAIWAIETKSQWLAQSVAWLAEHGWGKNTRPCNEPDGEELSDV